MCNQVRRKGGKEGAIALVFCVLGATTATTHLSCICHSSLPAWVLLLDLGLEGCNVLAEKTPLAAE